MLLLHDITLNDIKRGENVSGDYAKSEINKNCFLPCTLSKIVQNTLAK